MSAKIVESIMNQLEEKNKLDFCINSDEFLSREVLQKISCSNTFNGYNGEFDALNGMYCTPGCYKGGSDYVVIPKGTIYGPYQNLKKGKYFVTFFYEAKEKPVKVKVEVSSLDGYAVSEIVNFADKKTLVIDIPKNIGRIEYKLTNLGMSDLIFHRVCVKDYSSQLLQEANVSSINAYLASLNNNEEQAKRNQQGAILNNQFSSDLLEAEKKANCILPENFRFKFIKRVIRKIIKCFTRFQIEFNSYLVGVLKKFASEITRLSNEQRTIMVQCKNNTADLSIIHQELDKINEIKNNQKDYEDLMCEQRNNSGEISNLWNKMKELDDSFRNEWEYDRGINSEIRLLWEENIKLRKELFYEVDYRIRKAASISESLTHGTINREMFEPKIKSSVGEIVKNNNGKIRLNLGCGSSPVKGYINIDVRDIKGVDVVADVQRLPYEPNSVDEISSAHLIEHFERNIMENEVLPYWKDLLKPNGLIRIIFPDSEAMIEDYNRGEMSFEQLSYVVMGAQDYDKDYHYAMYNIQTVTDLLKKTGFRGISVVEKGRKNGGCRESELIARK